MEDDESIFDCVDDDDDDDGAFDTPHVRTSSSVINESESVVRARDGHDMPCCDVGRSRRRLNGSSSYRVKESKDDRKSQGVTKENLLIDEALNHLREEQARIDAHALSINAQSVKP